MRSGPYGSARVEARVAHGRSQRTSNAIQRSTRKRHGGLNELQRQSNNFEPDGPDGRFRGSVLCVGFITSEQPSQSWGASQGWRLRKGKLQALVQPIPCRHRRPARPGPIPCRHRRPAHLGPTPCRHRHPLHLALAMLLVKLHHHHPGSTPTLSPRLTRHLHFQRMVDLGRPFLKVVRPHNPTPTPTRRTTRHTPLTSPISRARRILRPGAGHLDLHQ